MGELDIYHQLKKQVLLECGMEHVAIQDCRTISIQIFNKNKNYISEHTLTRFFGFLPDANPSPFVLNSLSQFVGYLCWNDFRQRTQSKRTGDIKMNSTLGISPQRNPGNDNTTI